MRCSSFLAFAYGALATAECVTETTVMLGINTTITNLEAWQSSMDAKYSDMATLTEQETVFVHTSVYTFPGGSFTGYQTYNSEALLDAGYSIVTQTVTMTTCAESATTTPSLPPSPTTGVNCEPHNDHWHCDPVPTASEKESAECEPHDDHWHCPPGVPEPTLPPSANPNAESETTPSHAAQSSGVSEVPESGAVVRRGSSVGFLAVFSVILLHLF